MNDSTTRWIIGSVAAALWGATVVTATADIHLRWYLAILLATLVASLAVVACLVDTLSEARQAKDRAAGRAALSHVLAAIDQHANRMERSVNTHGRKMENSVFTAERWQANRRRGEILAQLDAAEARAAQRGDETGPLPAIFDGAR